MMTFMSSRRWLLLLIAIAAVLVVFALPTLKVAGWSGSKTLTVEVRVIEIDPPQEVAGAEVTVFDGPHSPIEGRVSWHRPAEFEPNPKSADTKIAVTDSSGIARLDYRFPAFGTSGVWVDSGHVDLSSVWVRVRALDRPPALVPLNRQSVGLRDIDDRTPVVLTIVLNKSATDQAHNGD
jgi:hypothetical protein